VVFAAQNIQLGLAEAQIAGEWRICLECHITYREPAVCQLSEIYKWRTA